MCLGYKNKYVLSMGYTNIQDKSCTLYKPFRFTFTGLVLTEVHVLLYCDIYKG